MDEKGRIGGVINLFDLFVLLAAGFLIWYYGVHVPTLIPSRASGIAVLAAEPKLRTKAKNERVSAVLEDVQFVFRDVSPDLAREVHISDKDITHPNPAAEFVEVLSAEPEVDIIDIGSKNPGLSPRVQTAGSTPD